MTDGTVIAIAGSKGGVGKTTTAINLAAAATAVDVDRSAVVVITKAGTGNAPPAERITGVLDVELLGEVPVDGTIPDAQDAGQSIITYDIASPAAEAYWQVAENLRLVRRDVRSGSVAESGP